MRFAQQRGFVEEKRNWESRLDVAAFDPAPFAGAAERVEARGIRICSPAELSADPDWRRRVYDMEMEVGEDEPLPDPFTPPSFEQYVKDIFEGPGFLPEGYFLAVDGWTRVCLKSLSPQASAGA